MQPVQSATPEPKPRRRRRLWTLRNVMLLTLPPLGVALWGTWAAVDDYREARQYQDWWTDQTSVRKFAYYRLLDLVNVPRSLVLGRTISPERADAETLQLFVEPRDWERLHADVEGRWDRWDDAELLLAGERLPVEIKLRGDNSVHWMGPKKSLTIKTEQGNHYKGYRRLGISLKDVLPAYLPTLVAPDFDVLSPRSEVLPLFVNGDFYGIYRWIETPDETFLRRHDLLPGNVFRADTAVRGEYFKNLPRQVFLNPYIWDRTAENIRPTGPGERGLLEFIEALNGTSFEEHEQFAAHFDGEELQRMLGLMLLFGDPYHMSGIHNQLWYEDPASGLLRPIVWDLRLLPVGNPVRDSRLNRFLEKALRDPRLHDGALRAVRDWLANPELRDRAVERLRETERTYGEHLAYERLREAKVHPVGRVSEIVETFDWNRTALAERLGDTRAAVHVASADGAAVLDIVVDGVIGCDLVALETGLADASGVRLVCDTDLDGRLGGSDREVATRAVGGRLELIAPEPLLAGSRAEVERIASEPLAYRLFAVGAGVDGLAPQLESRGTGEPVAPGALETDAALPETWCFHPWRFEPAPAEQVRLSGVQHLASSLFVEAGAELVIEPGTRLVLDPDVSIEARGRVLARGTAEQPILIEGSDPERPWGTFALQGAGANGSVFEHVRFGGGGGDLIGRVEYKGMVCVYHASDVTFADCEFTENLRCDDAINSIHSNTNLRRCTFTNALADAIDFDLSTGEIERCVIRGSGNDAIDLMSCSPSILGCTLEGSGDKGISVGEGAHPLVFDTLIRNCVTGMHVKDRSSPLVLDSRIEGCGVGLLQERKNWRYSASGRARLVGSVVTSNEVDYEGSGGATLTLLGTSIGEGQRAQAPDWMREAAGFREPSGGATSPRTWERIAPSEVVQLLEMESDLRDPSAGWRVSAGFERVDAVDGRLVARLHSAAGRLACPVEWDLSDPAFEYRLVVEAGGEDIASARLSVEGTGEPVDLALRTEADEDLFRFSTTLLPAGTYTRLVLIAAPVLNKDGEPKRASLRLDRISVLRRARGAG